VAAPEIVSAQPPRRHAPILWVDDQPKNNSYFVQQLADRGVTVDLALSTSEGVKQFERTQYGLVVSDMGRVENGSFRPTAGLELLQRVRAQSHDMPFIVFCSSRAAHEHAAEARALGVTAITSSPTELMGILEKELKK
jgi:CheY-like chemotaxis protein